MIFTMQLRILSILIRFGQLAGDVAHQYSCGPLETTHRPHSRLSNVKDEQ